MNITFIGMPGAGKSTLGKKVAELLHYRFIDIDLLIEQKEKLKLPEVLAKYGEKRFLELEEETIFSLGVLQNSILSPGGSVIYLEKAMEFLKNNSIMVFLDVPFPMIERRIGSAPRGIIGLQEKSLEQLFLERKILYEKDADAVVKVLENSDVEDVVGEALAILK